MYHTEGLDAPILSPHERFLKLVRDYEISEPMAMHLRQLEGFDIVLIGDDSGSMNTPVAPTHSSAPFRTRWDELKSQVSVIAQLATTLDSDGIDVYFLNSSGMNNVTSPHQVEVLFNRRPSGVTPLTKVFNQVVADKHDVLTGTEACKKLLVIVITDGQPSDEYGHSDINSFKRALKNKPDNVFVSIVACTDDDRTMSYLNHWDDTINNLDVVDDYVSERQEIRQAQGSGFGFTYGDYIVKILCGSIVKELDELDKRTGKGSKVMVLMVATLAIVIAIGARSLIQTFISNLG
ncbi:hypothetical protein P9112_007223 [Eukaryota sp. TZLM1-RC]